ncbi:MAG: Cys-Xaa-Xaa-Xaa repeat radical SAM target protein [Bacteroidaceae bacterium]|nr:Cys-Xaa-Xaa-Xaa repeat radical SAM target protein [Bacteroidaceae bacterium]
MEKKNQNEELQSRREFFKKAAKGVLPILGAAMLTGVPSIVKAVEESPMGCEYSCYSTCSGHCTGSCTGCSGSCQMGCQGSCRGTCSNTCTSSCHYSCYTSCYHRSK